MTRASSVVLGVLVAMLAGCASTLDPDLQRDDRCIYEIGSPHMIGSEYQLYKAHRRVPADDLLVATEDVPEARTQAGKAQLDAWLAIGSLVLGPVLFVPGIGLAAYGGAKSQPGSIAGGVVLAATGAAGIVAGIILSRRATREREHAIDAYNQQRAAVCRP